MNQTLIKERATLKLQEVIYNERLHSVRIKLEEIEEKLKEIDQLDSTL